MAGKRKSYNRVELFDRVKSYAEKIQSVEEEIGLIIKHLRQQWDGLAKEDKPSKMGQLKSDTHLLYQISQRLLGAGIMLHEFPKRKGRTDCIARDF